MRCLHLPEIVNRYTSNRVEEEDDAQRCQCGNGDESRTHIVGECERYKDDRDVLREEVRKIENMCHDKFGILGNSENRSLS